MKKLSEIVFAGLLVISISMLTGGCAEKKQNTPKKEINKTQKAPDTKPENTKKETDKKDDLKLRLKKIGATVETNEAGQQELVFNTLPVRPIKNLSVDDREYFKSVILKTAGNDPKTIMEKFPGIKTEDFENTGKLENSIDFQILLNNILTRTGLEPNNGEHLDQIINDLQNVDNE